MAQSSKNPGTLRPADCIARLPEIPLPEVVENQESSLRRVELRLSILAIADLNHVSETALVQGVVRHVLGKLPALEEQEGGQDGRLP